MVCFRLLEKLFEKILLRKNSRNSKEELEYRIEARICRENSCVHEVSWLFHDRESAILLRINFERNPPSGNEVLVRKTIGYGEKLVCSVHGLVHEGRLLARDVAFLLVLIFALVTKKRTKKGSLFEFAFCQMEMVQNATQGWSEHKKPFFRCKQPKNGL